MLFHIKHTTRYSYSRMVFCEPLTIRLRPREDSSQRLVRYQLAIDPAPAGRCEFLDLDGTTSTHCWFNGPTCTLSLSVNCVVETLRVNPFDFLLENGAAELPFTYRSEIAAALAPYRQSANAAGPIAELAEVVLAETSRNTIAFLARLAGWIHQNCKQVERTNGDPLPAETTLVSRQGACRDLAWLFCEVARHAGLAARFVSGYQAHPEVPGKPQLHAWSEVFLPGAGWRGFDPSLGLTVADQHVALATGLCPAAAAAITGSFRGTEASSTMDSQLVIRVS